jgi:hypothetical protein
MWESFNVFPSGRDSLIDRHQGKIKKANGHKMDQSASRRDGFSTSCPLLDAWWKNPSTDDASKKSKKADKGTSLKQCRAKGWRFLRVPLLIEDQLYWRGRGEWLAIPPDEYPYAARKFAKRRLAVAWAADLDGTLNREKAFKLLVASTAAPMPKLVG